MKKIVSLLVVLTAVLPLFRLQAHAAPLSKNDQLFREDIRYRLDARLRNKVDMAISRYKAKIATMNKADADRLTDSILAKVDNILFKMRISQPLDKSLAKKPDDKYLAYMLLKFELTLLR